MAEENLKHKTLKGVGWSATNSFLSQGVSFIIGIILARLLGPGDYGMIGMAMIVITILNTFVDSGFSTALVRKTDVADDEYNTMFYVNLGVSIIAYGILFVAAPLVSRFFDLEITAIIRLLGLTIIINSLAIVQGTILTKKVDFKTSTIASAYSSIIGGIVGICAAFLGCGVWALVVQNLVSSIVNVVALWSMNRWRPSWKFSRNSLRYMWGFGSRMLLSSLLNQTWQQIYQIVVGKFYNPSTLGQYSRAKHYAAFLTQNITVVVQRVSFPTLANIQNEEERMVAIYRRIIKTTMFVTAICVFALGAVSVPLIYCMIGEAWLEAASYLPLICISMSLYPLHVINLNMLQIQGRSDLFLYLEIIKKIISIGPICLGIFVSIRWMLIGTIITGIIGYFLNSYYTGKKLHYTSWMQIKDVAPSYGIAILVALSVYFFRYLPLSYFIILPIQIVMGLSVFFVICEMTKPEEYIELKSIAVDAIHKYRRNE